MGSEQNEGTTFLHLSQSFVATAVDFPSSASNTNHSYKCYCDLRAGEEQAAKTKAVMEKFFGVETKVEEVAEAIKLVEEPSLVASSSTTVERQAAVVAANIFTGNFCLKIKMLG
ncbi:hypothetical protein V6N13_036275 [Hibiscus sabdariffa]|uniref:Uncharacterized protein n=1 Tax=Hibiscus sabdariffa TaxID=183260 RepID=A0ABR2S797_9ROSI